MKALILKGQFAGKEAEISQWCNDWFTLQEYTHQPLSPSSLAFTSRGMKIIREHKNNGVLFEEFEVVGAPKPIHKQYRYTFRKKQPKEEPREYLTPTQAWECTDKSDKETVHVFHNPNGAMLIGFDVSVDRIKVAFGQAKSIEIGGEQCLGMGHGIVVTPKGAKFHGDIWFIKHDESALKKYTKRV